MKYLPSQSIIDNYANVLINYALNNGRGIKKNEVVFLQVPESAKSLLFSLHRAVLAAGAHPIIQYLPDEFEHEFFQNAADHQINFFPTKFLKGKVAQADHLLTIIAETNKHELEGIDPHKIMQHHAAFKPYFDWRHRKENLGKLSWTIGLFPTVAMAQEANLTLRQCWRQVIRACYLDHPTPIKKWQEIGKGIDELRSKLNHLSIDSLHLQSTNTDLHIGLDHNRQWLSGDGCNIPSFEIFISPDWRRLNGHISFDMPLYSHGNLIKDIYLEFKDGIVTKATASRGEKILQQMVAVKNADKVGEFSLTDRRFSRINHFMAETLYDENFGGLNGNCHLALGASFAESYTGKKGLTNEKLFELGFNDSAIHTDIIATTPRTVTATLTSGQEKLIYKNGKFTI